MPFSHSRVAACDQSLLPLDYIIMEACLNLSLLSTMCSSFLQPYFEPQPCSSHIFYSLPQATSAVPAKVGYLESRKNIGVHGKFSVLLVLLFFSIFIWWIPMSFKSQKKAPNSGFMSTVNSYYSSFQHILYHLPDSVQNFFIYLHIFSSQTLSFLRLTWLWGMGQGK